MKTLISFVRIIFLSKNGSTSFAGRVTSRQYSYSSKGSKISLGDVSLLRKPPKHPELVPLNYIQSELSQSTLRHLRWIMQKDVLGQDVFLIGPPGPLKRLIAMQYLELTRKEVEYLSLSRDTTESDIKQRREIRSKTAHYIDQCAVRAAVEGRVLVLEGIEKAERNVLPVLNNLLENREMQLEDGRFLMAAERYDKLLKEHSKEELDAWKVTRVHEDFRVIALGLPVPQFQGNPLDPPLRSRFQARDINPLAFREQLDDLLAQSHSLKHEQLSPLLSFAYTMLSPESTSLGLPPFPLDQLPAAVAVLAQVPNTPSHQIIHSLYPYDIFLSKEGQQSVIDTLQRFDLLHDNNTVEPVDRVVRITQDVKSHSAAVTLDAGGEEAHIKVMSGVGIAPTQPASDWFVFTNYHESLISQLMKSHLVKDFCVVGPKGCGKTAIIKKFAEMLSYEVETVMLYQDMTARDLLQQRTTLENGDTVWRDSPLVNAALSGRLAILDGIHTVNSGTLAVIHRLVHDRELQLFDGKRLLRADRYDTLKSAYQLADKDLEDRGIFRIHPAFRMAAAAEPPVVGSSTQQWLNAELLSLFFYHNVRPLSVVEESQVIQGTAHQAPSAKMDSILQFTHKLRTTPDLSLRPVATSLSTRQLLRISHRLQKYPDERAFDAVQKACLSRFLPSLTKLALNKSLEEAGIFPVKDQDSAAAEDWDQSVTCEVKDGIVRIGHTSVPVFKPDVKTKVPDVLFYDNTQHLSIMEDMLKDFMLGEHLLLVGNQGVGKNKIVDRFLHLLCRPREYIQLHRDTTVQTLTLQPTVRDGVIVYEDSPLVRAVKFGHVLVIDEADKAPTHVTCILKTLVEAGAMVLADGRKITSSSDKSASGNIIEMHPNFRMIVLANRPGFPFLGNDFFAVLGDTFSCHAVDNPSFDSEVAMLQKYGPDVPRPLLQKLVEAFGDLRSMADEGLIAYPYSTREVVNIVKHLQMFPNEGLATVVSNVFDFDQYNNEAWDTLKQTLHKHGIPLGTRATSISLAKEFPLPRPTIISNWSVSSVPDSATGPVHLPVEDRTLHRGKPTYSRVVNEPMDRIDSRSQFFHEEQMHWRLPMHENNIITDIAVTKCGDQMKDLIHVTTANPVTVMSMSAQKRIISCIELYNLFQETRGGYRPQVGIATLGGHLMGHILIHEEIVNKALIVDTTSGLVYPIHTSSYMESAVQEITDRIIGRNKGFYKMCADFADKDLVLFYQNNGECLEVVRPNAGTGYNIHLPLRIEKVLLVAEDKWLVIDKDSKKKFLLQKPEPSSNYVHALHSIEEDSPLAISGVGRDELRPFALAAALGQQISSPNRIVATNDNFAAIAVGFPDLHSAEVHSFARPSGSSSHNGHRPPIFLAEAGQLVNLTYESPDVHPSVPDVGCYLEVVDLIAKKVRYIPVPNAVTEPPYSAWLAYISPTHVLASSASNDGVVTVDAGGCVRMWETGTTNLEHSLSEWKNMIGRDTDRPIEIKVDLEEMQELSEPKHGKIDPMNMPHVGGGTWAGGVGGRGTAGLGGYGGPYRLDAGHNVHQVPDHIKDSVPEEIRKAAREMARKAYKERLKQINMSEFDAELYERLSGNIRKQVQSLRVILDSLQAKSKERQWMRHQTSGELDDLKLIEGLTGERAIYKRRGEKEPEMGAPQQKPKRLKLLTDVSGSMYRFDGYDGRLQRMMEAALLVMEAFEKYDEKFKYEIIGHSGEDYEVDLLPKGDLPKNDKERLDLLKTMHAHSQFCMSGDHTLEATVRAINNIAKEDADERFVIVLSDANFDRYGIQPSSFARALTSNPDVNAFAIFIGSLGDQAVRLTKALPSGRGFVCLNTQIIPDVLRQIFTSSLLAK